jgi:hypothetical protein
LETLAGRIAYIDLSHLDVLETPADEHTKLWVRGGFPESFLAETDARSLIWRQDFIRTYLERDIGKHISTLAAPDVVDEIPNILARIAAGERIGHYQTRRRTKDIDCPGLHVTTRYRPVLAGSNGVFADHRTIPEAKLCYFAWHWRLLLAFVLVEIQAIPPVLGGTGYRESFQEFTATSFQEMNTTPG